MKDAPPRRHPGGFNVEDARTTVVEGREYGPAGRYGQYEVSILDEAGNTYRGFGMTLERVVAEESGRYRRRYEMWKEAGRETEEEFVGGEPDRVVWAGLRVLCILRPTVGGSLDVLSLGAPSAATEGGAS